MEYLVGIDIGTSSVKVIALTPGGRTLAVAGRAYSLLEPRPGWKEQDVEEIRLAVEDALVEVVAQVGGTPLAYAFSSAMHSLQPVDAVGRPLGHTIIWADTRSWEQATRLRQDGVGRRIYAATGTPIHPMSPLCKLMWLRDTNAERFSRAHRFLTIKSYLLHHWCGRYAIDYSDASSTGLFDIRRLGWFTPALEVAGITPERLPEPVPTTAAFAIDRPDLLARLGAAGAAPVIAGASDGCLANLGSQVMTPGEAALTIGTSGAIRVGCTAPLVDPRGRLFNYLLADGYYISGGAVNNGALLLQWFREEFGGGQSTEALLAAAAAIPAGAGGLLCLPYLLGERSPVWDGRARGAFVGLSDRHTPTHLLRALLEGICFNLREVGRLLEDQGARIDTIYASGGFTRSAFWVQLLADIFGRPVVLDASENASAAGAVMLALYALGRVATLDGFGGFIQRQDIFQPDAALHDRYQAYFQLYRRLYPALHEVTEGLSGMENDK